MINTYSCISVCQRYVLKANHNTLSLYAMNEIVVFQCVKDTFWKQITTAALKFIFLLRCISVCQRYVLKANHNGQHTCIKFFRVVFQCVKDTFWKQITTVTKMLFNFKMLYFSVSKIRFESKSQPAQCFVVFRIVVFQCVKDTFWKQITTAQH